MPLLLFLNERSCESGADADAVDAAMSEFIRVLKHVKQWREIALVTRSPLKLSELARGYYYQQWANRNPDGHRYLLTLRSRSPFRVELISVVDADDVEYQHDGLSVEGIGAAHLVDGLAVSLPLARQWAQSWLTVDIRRVVETAEGELVLEEVRDQVRHCSSRGEADHHESWARETGLGAITSARQLWAQRAELFPHLQFLPRVERDLAHLDLKWLVPVRTLLARLEASVVAWDPAAAPFPAWQVPHITPEGEQRKLHCQFEDLDRVTRTFDLHGRMTPGKGRMHFRLVPEEKALRVAYIGPKLGA